MSTTYAERVERWFNTAPRTIRFTISADFAAGMCEICGEEPAAALVTTTRDGHSNGLRHCSICAGYLARLPEARDERAKTS